VTLRIGSRIFSPSWFSVVLTLALLPVFIKLGLWQLHRAEEKRALMQAAAAGRQHTLVYTSSAAASLPRYQQVSVTGRYLPHMQMLLDNMPSSQGQPGYRVWTPLMMADGQIIVIDRGWLPLGATRQQLPDVSVGDAPRTVVGLLDELPRPGTRAGDAGIVQDRWPQVLNYPTLNELQSLFSASLASRILLLNTDQADGYERKWQIDLGFTPERHVAYAAQWFGFAVTLLVIFFVVNLKRPTAST
jgi:surfeit locus 1 family protein